MKCQDLFSLKNKRKKIKKLSSAAVVTEGYSALSSGVVLILNIEKQEKKTGKS